MVPIFSDDKFFPNSKNGVKILDTVKSGKMGFALFIIAFFQICVKYYYFLLYKIIDSVVFS